MEAASGVVLRQSHCFSSSGYYAKESKSCCSLRRGGRGISSSGLYDKDQLRYYYNYNCSILKSENQVKEKGGGPMKIKKKKQMKLLKGLARDLSTFSKVGFGLDSDMALIDQVKGNIITEATDQLLEQLHQKLKEKKELKMKKKEEKIRLKAIHMQNRLSNRKMSPSSSSSSSESSDSDCGEVIDMIGLKRAQTMQNYPEPVIDNPIATVTLSPTCSKKFEVCMGGKCKKSGAGAILEEFERVVGVEGAVSGCKCMGKCGDGPNVRVVSGFDGGVHCSVRGGGGNGNGSVCVGVGLEDVNMIVDNFVGEKGKELCFAAAA